MPLRTMNAPEGDALAWYSPNTSLSGSSAAPATSNSERPGKSASAYEQTCHGATFDRGALTRNAEVSAKRRGGD